MTELDVDENVVRRLLANQAPQFADYSLNLAATGWDNAVWRLGDHLAVRLPRRLLAAPLVEHEQRLLPEVAPRLPLPIPSPMFAGRAMAGAYPWSWSVVPWFDGDRAATHPPVPDEAAGLGRFLAALHAIPPAGAPANPFRDGPLANRSERVRDRVVELANTDDAGYADIARAAFETGLAAAPATVPTLIHGDLHARNVLTRDGRLAAVIDWGDMTAGDPAVDLAAVWWLFVPAAHGGFWTAYDAVSTDTWQRARAWAAYFGLMFLGLRQADHAGLPDEAGAELGRELLRRVEGT